MSVESWKVFFEVGGLFVLALTFIFGGGAWMTSNILNKRQDVQLGKFSKDLADAKTEQSKQQERAARAEKALAEVGNVAGAANERAAKLELEAAELRIQTAQANERVEELKADNLNLQRIIQPRRIMGAASKEKYDALEAFSGMSVFIFVVPDFEAKTFANDIGNILVRVGWKPEIRITSRLFDGVSVYSGEFPEPGSSPDREWLAGNALADLLTSEFAATETGGAGTHILNLDGRILPITSETYSRPEKALAITVGMRPIYDSLMIWKYAHALKKKKP